MDRIIALYNLETGYLKSARNVTGLSDLAVQTEKQIMKLQSDDPRVVVDSAEPLHPEPERPPPPPDKWAQFTV